MNCGWCYYFGWKGLVKYSLHPDHPHENPTPCDDYIAEDEKFIHPEDDPRRKKPKLGGENE